jgi:uncharacterized protein
MRRTAAAAVILIISIFMACPTIAGSFDEALEACDRGDHKTEYRLIKPLADQGDASAQYHLGVMYDDGHGVPQDFNEAMRWYGKAADNGNAEAQCNLGSMYVKGHGVPQDYDKASMWYEMAAGKGNAKAQFNIGELYASGKGVPQDYVLAYMWFTLAASHYPASEIADRNNVAKKINEIALKMVPEEIAEAQRMAREWKPKR